MVTALLEGLPGGEVEVALDLVDLEGPPEVAAGAPPPPPPPLTHHTQRPKGEVSASNREERTKKIIKSLKSKVGRLSAKRNIR